MKKLVAVGVIVLFIGMTISSSTGVYLEKQSIKPLSSGNILYVGGSGPGNYTKIRYAIDDASDGDTVFVYEYSSPYIENIIVDKSINLIGENRTNTIIDGGSPDKKYLVVEITADWVNISGFTIQNGRGGIYVLSSHTNVSNNNIANHRYGLDVQGSHNTVIGNNISFNVDGIIFICDSDAIIIDNTISDNYKGINICDELNVNISGNNISHNDYGIYAFAMWGDCNISGNIFSKNEFAIGMGNTYSNNIFSNNIFSDNHCGIVLESGYGDSIISGNNFTNNDIGVLITASNSKKIFNNNFIKNNVSATFRLLSLHNKWDGNYWDRPRLLPYPIIGCLGLFIPSWVNFDWHPAQEPYDIGV